MKYRATLVAALILISPMAAYAAPANAAETSDNTLEAITDIAPDLLDSAQQISGSASNEVALSGSLGPSHVEVASDAVDGISIDGGNNSLTIGLPFATSADAAKVEQPGVVSYDNNNGSTTVPVVRTDGTLQISTVIENSDAPRQYAYPIDMPRDSTLIYDGAGAAIVNAAGETTGRFEAPWAFDSAGHVVPTHYVIEATTLIQIVDHGPGVAYPVVADPTWVGSTLYYSRSEVRELFRYVNNVDNVCRFTPLNYLGGIGCGVTPPLKDAVTQAYYQNKRVKAVYRNCGFNYCSYYTYSVVA